MDYENLVCCSFSLDHMPKQFKPNRVAIGAFVITDRMTQS